MFEPVPFSRISYAEIPDILTDKSESEIMKELKAILSPVYNSSIVFDNVYYSKLDNIDEFNNLKDKSYIFRYIKRYGESFSDTNPNDLIIVYSPSFDSDSEILYKRAHDLNWNMIADESTDIESGLIFMYVFTEKQNAVYKTIQQNLIEIAHAEGIISEEEYTKNMTDEEKVEYLKQEDGPTIIYYVSYGIMGEKAIEDLGNIIISLKDYISTMNDIIEIRSIIANNKQVRDEQVLIFAFSLMGNPLDGIDPESFIDNSLADNLSDQEDPIGTGLGFYCNRITYRFNDKERVYDSWQNIDICADEKSTEHLAKSIIADHEGLTEEELAEVEIINVELLSSGSFDSLSDIEEDDDDNEEI